MDRTVEFWNGESLPPVGCYVGYVTDSSGLEVSKVTGYDVQEAADPVYGSHRVMIQIDGNCWLLHDLVSVHNLGSAIK